MTTMEEKRKELELDAKDSKLFGVNVNPYEFILEGFDLGVEMARKEFLRNLVFIIQDEIRIRISRHPERDKHIDRFANHIMTRIKQSLEEKGK